MANMNILALEKVFTPGIATIEKRESLYINKFEAEFRGLNRKKVKLVPLSIFHLGSEVQHQFKICSHLITPDDVIVIITKCIVSQCFLSVYLLENILPH